MEKGRQKREQAKLIPCIYKRCGDAFPCLALLLKFSWLSVIIYQKTFKEFL